MNMLGAPKYTVNNTVEEATWETEHYLNENYPGFLESRQSKFFSLYFHLLNPKSRDEISFKAGRL
jgi:hypothetical protein